MYNHTKQMNHMKTGDIYTGAFKDSTAVEYFGFSKAKKLFYVVNKYDASPSYYTEEEFKSIIKNVYFDLQPQY